MTTTFHVSVPASEMRLIAGERRCRIERINKDSCYVVLVDKEEVNWFKLYAKENNIEYTS